IVALVPAIEAAVPKARRAIAQGASTRFSRLSVDRKPNVKEAPKAARAIALTQELSAALEGHEVRAAFYTRGHRNHSAEANKREVIAVSIRLMSPEAGAEQWLNVISRSSLPHRRGFPQEVFLIVLGL